MLVNFHHPVSADHLGQIREVSGIEPGGVVDVSCHFHDDRPLAPQAVTFVDEAGLTAVQWQAPDLLVVLPGHADLAALILSDIHGRRGGFPLIVHRRPAAQGDSYEVSEILNLNAVRRSARATRAQSSAEA